jgi:hypothetical protein
MMLSNFTFLAVSSEGGLVPGQIMVVIPFLCVSTSSDAARTV